MSEGSPGSELNGGAATQFVNYPLKFGVNYDDCPANYLQNFVPNYDESPAN